MDIRGGFGRSDSLASDEYREAATDINQVSGSFSSATHIALRKDQPMTNQPHRILRRREVEARTGIARSTIYQLVSEKRFPAPVRLGERSVGWVEAEVDAWLSERIAARTREAA